MIRINLLSPTDKLNIKWEKINRLATYNYAIIIVMQVFFVFILLVTVGYLNIEEKKLNAQLGNMQSGSEVREINLIKGEAIKYNNQLSDILEVQEKQFYWVKCSAHVYKKPFSRPLIVSSAAGLLTVLKSGTHWHERSGPANVERLVQAEEKMESVL